jgi:cobalt-zinc-cadmium efflux system protein
MEQHQHNDRALQAGRAFRWAAAVNIAFVAVEALFGFLTGSLALLADAAHNLTDVLGLVVAWGAVSLSRLRPNEYHTYGFGRATVLAALANGIALLIGVGFIIREAIERIGVPQDIPATTVLWVAGLGIAVNTGSALLFLKGRAQDINVRGAFLHMAADAAVSVGVVISALVIMFTGLAIVDPIVAIVVSAVIAVSAFGLFKSAIHLSLDGVPQGVDLKTVGTWLRAQPGVANLHDLHIWALSTTSTALTAHLVMPEGCPGDSFLEQTARNLETRFGIAHATLQVERGTETECRLANPARP